MHITVKNIVNLIEQHGINANQLSIECGLNNSAITEWKKGKSKPSEKKLQVIADYFKKPLHWFYEDHTCEGASSASMPPPKPKTIEELPENLMSTIEKIIALCNEHHVTKTMLEKKCGLSQNSINKWATSKPSADALSKIADYFHVSVDWLLGRTDNPQPYQNSKPTSPPKSNTIEKLPDNLTPENVIMFPIIGMIAAGYDGNVSFDPTGDEIPVPEYLLKTHNPNDYFVLQVIGNSMLPTYHNGDKVLIRKTDSVDSGTIAAVGFDTENATLKKVEYVKGKNWMKLIPLNPDFPIKEIKGPDLDLCHVYGEVVYKLDNRIVAPRADMQSNSELADKINALSPEKQRLLLELIDKMSKE